MSRATRAAPRALLLTAATTALLPAAGCRGARNPTPVAPDPTPTPPATPTSTHPLAGLVYYDEDGNGALDPGEDVRLPRVAVNVGGVTAVTGADGRFQHTAVPAGARSTLLEAASLPPYFAPGALPSVTLPVPQGFSLSVPVVLPIGSNRPNVYMAFGDSITLGDGSRGRNGYRSELAAMLRGYWRRAEIANEGVEGSHSDAGAARLAESLARVRPAWTLLLYGTNDWNSFGGRQAYVTADNLRRMVRDARAAGSRPVVGSVIPVNPAFRNRLPEERNAWIEGTNARIKAMALEERVVLADLHAAFLQEAGGDLAALFSDHVHPNDRGYAAIAREFFRAITEPVGVR